MALTSILAIPHDAAQINWIKCTDAHHHFFFPWDNLRTGTGETAPARRIIKKNKARVNGYTNTPCFIPCFTVASMAMATNIMIKNSRCYQHQSCGTGFIHQHRDTHTNKNASTSENAKPEKRLNQMVFFSMAGLPAVLKIRHCCKYKWRQTIYSSWYNIEHHIQQVQQTFGAVILLKILSDNTSKNAV